jgi:hypothetical protein
LKIKKCRIDSKKIFPKNILIPQTSPKILLMIHLTKKQLEEGLNMDYKQILSSIKTEKLALLY